jgi:hypothetical protein
VERGYRIFWRTGWRWGNEGLSKGFDRPLFTYVHTFVIVDKRTSIVLGSGKVTAFDRTIASGRIAKDIVKIFSAVRFPASSKVVGNHGSWRANA